MARSKAEAELRVSGLHLWARFSLAMTLTLAAVMAVAGYLLYTTTTSIAQTLEEDAFVAAAKMMLENPQQGKDYWQEGRDARQFDGGAVKRFEIRQAKGMGYLYQAERDGQIANLIVPQAFGDSARQGLLGLIIGISSAVILIGAIVSYIVANQIAQPLNTIIEDIRQIAHGNLRHKTRVTAGGEISLLAKTVDRMTASLAEAQEAELELSMRDRELEVAGEVREALLPERTPRLSGFDVAAAHFSSPETGGDFHEFIEYADGRVGFLVCDVSGTGVPGALVGATARSYLRSILPVESDVAAAFKRVNRELARDVRRGMYVTAMYVLIDPSAANAQVVCAGHKLPLVRISAEDKKVRLVQPEGIALGFDKGPVFDRSLAVQELAIAPGDRLLLSTTGPVRVANDQGEELGEKEFYKFVAKWTAKDSTTVLKAVRKELESWSGNEELPIDISLVTIGRDRV